MAQENRFSWKIVRRTDTVDATLRYVTLHYSKSGLFNLGVKLNNANVVHKLRLSKRDASPKDVYRNYDSKYIREFHYRFNG